MNEKKELKAGDDVVYSINNNDITMRPIPFGRIKKIMKIVFKAIDEIGEDGQTNSAFLRKLPELIEKNMDQLLPLIFDTNVYKFINQEWIDDNITIPLSVKIFEDAIKINGLSDFFSKMTRKPGAKVEPQKKNPVEPIPLVPMTP